MPEGSVVQKMNRTSGGGSSSVLSRTSQPSLMRWTSSMMKTLLLQVGRRRVDARQQLAHVVDAVVARGVQLDDVERAPFADGHAAVARVVWLAVDGVRAVDRLGDDPRRAGLAGAARADEEQAVGEAVRAGRRCAASRRPRPGRRLGERLGPPAPVERLVRGRHLGRHGDQAVRAVAPSSGAVSRPSRRR